MLPCKGLLLTQSLCFGEIYFLHFKYFVMMKYTSQQKKKHFLWLIDVQQSEKRFVPFLECITLNKPLKILLTLIFLSLSSLFSHGLIADCRYLTLIFFPHQIRPFQNLRLFFHQRLHLFSKERDFNYLLPIFVNES